MVSESDSEPKGWMSASGVVMKTVVLIGGALFLKRYTKSTTRWDHARLVAQSLTGEKNSREQASKDSGNYFNLRMMTCPAAEMVDGSNVLYFEQAFWRTPQKPFKQRFFMVKPCPKEMKCEVEDGNTRVREVPGLFLLDLLVWCNCAGGEARLMDLLSAYAIRDTEEYRNFCDRPKDQRPPPDEVMGDIAEHLATVHLKRCDRGKGCLYEGSTPPGGFPNSWNGASYCTSDMAVLKNNVIHTWDRGYDDDGNQVWGRKDGPYKFKTAPVSSFDEMLSPLNQSPLMVLEKKIDGHFALLE